MTWYQTALKLRANGWKTEYVPKDGLPRYLWRAPDGTENDEHRSHHVDAVPEAVMKIAHAAGVVDFLHLAPAS